MSRILDVLHNNEKCYQIVFHNEFNELSENIKNLKKNYARICIVTDSNVEDLYANEVINELNSLDLNINTFKFDAGEQQKNLQTVQKLYEYLIQNHYTRDDLLLALGGGVVGDLTGFTAATYLRGIDFIQVPTTLLSQVDSSIGGKTGVDFDSYKNMVGAFHMPKLVYMNLSTLQTLPGIQYSSGIAEVLKSALIKNGKLYEWLINNFCEIMDLENDIIEEMIYETCLIKKNIVESDPYEKGERALLNFGHTIGHAIEKYKNFTLTHGECVALGCIAASFISYKRELLTSDEYYEIRDMFLPFGLPLTVTDLDLEEIYKNISSDKKMTTSGLKFILLKNIGKGIIDHTVTKEEIINALNEIYFSDEDMMA